MTRTIVGVDGEVLVRAQRVLQTPTWRDTVNAALELAAAVDADRRAHLLGSFQQLLGRLDRRPNVPDAIEEPAASAA